MKPLTRLSLSGILLLSSACPARAAKPKEAAIDKAIARGVDWLKKNIDADEGLGMDPESAKKGGLLVPDYNGRSFFRAMALVQAGVKPSDPAIAKIWRSCQAQTPGYVYEASVQLMLGEAIIAAADPAGPSPKAVQESMRKKADWLAAACVGGNWAYDEAKQRPKPGISLPPAEKSKKKAKKGAPPEGGPDSPHPRLGSPELCALVQDKLGDYSNAHFAVLGLKAAALCGVRPADADLLWRVIAQQFLAAQEPPGDEIPLKIEPVDPAAGVPWWPEDGLKKSVKTASRGWGYVFAHSRQGKTYGSMTSCGVGALLIARAEIPDLSQDEKDLIDEAIRSGIAWLSLHHDVTRNPEGENCDAFSKAATFYHLYGLERTGMLGNVARFGARDWYADGAAWLLAQQEPDGGWPKGQVFETRSIRTAFALMFLKRSTSVKYAQDSRKVGYTVGGIAGEEKKPAEPVAESPEPPEPEKKEAVGGEKGPE